MGKHSSYRSTFIVIILFNLVLGANLISAQTPLTTTVVQSGFTSPLYVTAPPGDFERIFVVEQGGRIKIIKNGNLLPTPFLNLSTKVSCCGERGLLGLAFHPNYANNGYFYVNYTNTAGNTVVARYQVSTNPDSADTVGVILLTVTQPFSNHNGGWIGFSPYDGYLYIALGDGGSGGDPQNNGQDSLTLLGKILRIDVDTSSGYKVPPDNPFIGTGFLPEIWAYGLRNPWRCSFDRLTGDFYIADVGQNAWEEVNFEPDTSSGGINYGWRLKEGTHCFNPSTNCDTLGLTTDPIYEYPHSDGCSVTGGYVYRGCAIPDLQGTYFFGDYCSGTVWSFQYDGVDPSEFQDRTAELGVGFFNISSFGEDGRGEIYIVGHNNGIVYRIVPDGVPTQCGNCLAVSGDVNGTPPIDLADVLHLVNYVFDKDRPTTSCLGSDPGNCWTLDPPCRGEINGTPPIGLPDVIHLVNYVFDKARLATSCQASDQVNCWPPVQTGVCCLPAP
jgi:glucose/arabinose dehydrogenase